MKRLGIFFIFYCYALLAFGQNTSQNGINFNNISAIEKIVEGTLQYTEPKNQKTLATKENHITQLQRQSIIAQYKGVLTLSGIIITGIIILSLFINYSRKRERAIAMYNAQEQIFQSEINRKAIKEKKLKEMLASKNRDITNLSLDIVRKNEFSEELKKRLDDLEEELPLSLKEKIKDLQIFTISHLQINDDLATLQTNVEDINQEFYKKLEDLDKDLNQNEKQLCGLIRLNLSNKEVAVIRKISTNSAKVARYRLRKKLELNPEDNIVEFLQKI